MQRPTTASVRRLMKNDSPQQGVTIFELMITLIVAAILLSIAVPSFSNLFDKNRVKGAAEELTAQIQFARSEAISRGMNVSVALRNDGGNWCIGVDEEEDGDSTPGCDCGTDDDCQVNGLERVTEGSEFGGVAVSSGDDTVTFEGTRGLPTGGVSTDFEFSSDQGKGLNVSVNQIGRARLCSPAGSTNLWEYPECPSP